MSQDFADGSSTSRVPARRRRGATDGTDYEDNDLARGQAAAVLGVLGRMQLRLDVLAREQATAFERLEARLSRLESMLPDSDPQPWGTETRLPPK